MSASEAILDALRAENALLGDAVTQLVAEAASAPPAELQLQELRTAAAASAASAALARSALTAEQAKRGALERACVSLSEEGDTARRHAMAAEAALLRQQQAAHAAEQRAEAALAQAQALALSLRAAETALRDCRAAEAAARDVASALRSELAVALADGTAGADQLTAAETSHAASAREMAASHAAALRELRGRHQVALARAEAAEALQDVAEQKVAALTDALAAASGGSGRLFGGHTLEAALRCTADANERAAKLAAAAADGRSAAAKLAAQAVTAARAAQRDREETAAGTMRLLDALALARRAVLEPRWEAAAPLVERAAAAEAEGMSVLLREAAQREANALAQVTEAASAQAEAAAAAAAGTAAAARAEEAMAGVVRTAVAEGDLSLAATF